MRGRRPDTDVDMLDARWVRGMQCGVRVLGRDYRRPSEITAVFAG
jgi:hypothetical protein